MLSRYRHLLYAILIFRSVMWRRLKAVYPVVPQLVYDRSEVGPGLYIEFALLSMFLP